MRLLEPTAQIWMKIDPYKQRQKYRPMTSFWNYKVYALYFRILAGVPVGGDLKWEWGGWRLQFLAIWVATSSETSESHWPTFLSLHVWIYLHSNLCSGLQKTHLFCNGVRFGRSRSSKVDDFCTNRKRVYDSCLSPVVTMVLSILHPFCDMATYWLEIAYFSYPSFIRRPCSYVRFGISRWS